MSIHQIQGAKITLPSRSVFDPRFKHRDSSKTDVRLTWRKARLYMRLNGIEQKRIREVPITTARARGAAI